MRLALAVLLVGCSGPRLHTADTGAPSSPSAAVAAGVDASSGDAGGVGFIAPPSIRRPVLEDAGAVDAGPVPECVEDGDCTAPVPPVRCSTANNLRTSTGWFCTVDGICDAASTNTWCPAGCEAGACL